MNSIKIRLTVLILLILSTNLNIFSTKLVKKESHTETGKFDEDYMFNGKHLNFQGECEDLFFTGDKLDFNGTTQYSIFAIGKDILLNGTINNDLISGARQTIIKKEINGTAFIGGQSVFIKDDAKLNGDLFFAGKTLEIKGDVTGDIRAFSGEIEIYGTITGNVKVKVGKIILHENARINGDLIYYTDNELDSEELSKISGETFFHYDDELSDYKNWNKKGFHREKQKMKPAFFIITTFIRLIGFFLFGILALLFPITKRFENIELTNRKFWFRLLWGLIPFVIYIPVTILTIPIPPIFLRLLMASFPILWITQFIGIVIFGKYLFTLFKWDNNNRYLFFMFAFIFYFLASFIPIIFFFNIAFFSSIGLGLILEKIFNKKLV